MRDKFWDLNAGLTRVDSFIIAGDVSASIICSGKGISDVIIDGNGNDRLGRMELRALIDLFWMKYSQLKHAVIHADEQTVVVLDREVESLLASIFERQATNAIEIQMQFLLLIELLKREAEDESSVVRHVENLRKVVERHIMPGSVSKSVPNLQQLAPISDVVLSNSDREDLLDLAVLESLADRVAVVTPDYRYLFTNSVNASALDRAPEEIVGRHIGEFVGLHRFVQGLQERLDRCFSGEIVDYTYADQIGERTVVVRCRLSPYYSPSNELVGALMLTEEIADRRQSSAA